MDVMTIPALEDNWIHLLRAGSEAAVVDPGDAAPVLALIRAHRWTLRAVLLTHAHGDHVAGAAPLRAETGCIVIGPDGAGFPNLDRTVRDGDSVDVPGGALKVLSTPGHLPVHLSYHDPVHEALFCGDALFGGGCGRLLGGGTAAQAFTSLQRLRALPENTRVYCGHEYTVDNLSFAASLEPHNAEVAGRLCAARAAQSSGRPTIPSTIAEEKRTNPFLRADDPAMARAVGLPGATPEAVFAELRRRKDRW